MLNCQTSFMFSSSLKVMNLQSLLCHVYSRTYQATLTWAP